MTETPAHHTAAHWARMRRNLEGFTVTEVKDGDDHLMISAGDGRTIGLSKADLGREIHVGEELWLETAQGTRITGLRDRNGWLFQLSDQDLADQARQFADRLNRDEVVRLEQSRKRYAQQEADLPAWLRARIQRFRDAGGEHFLLTGWGYELIICRLAALLDADDRAGADKLAADEGASDNQWECAKALVVGRQRDGDEFAVRLPAGTALITGSADYST
jgi:hypothetical protein